MISHATQRAKIDWRRKIGEVVTSSAHLESILCLKTVTTLSRYTSYTCMNMDLSLTYA